MNAFKIKIDRVKVVSFSLAVIVLTQSGCARVHSQSASNAGQQVKTQFTAPDPGQVVLAALGGTSELDGKIARQQERVRAAKDRFPAFEQLGWLFVAKARASFDPGYYRLAEQCALAMNALQSDAPEALLLRGHALQNLHRFKEAEPLARELVSKRGQSFDFGLLGDSLLEQGRLDEAVAAYQRMVDLRPDLQAYARVGYIRWLKGDTQGAIQMMHVAVEASSQNDPDSAAWVCTRLALLQFQSGRDDEARSAIDAALLIRPNYPPALLLRGRMLLAGKQADEAVAALQTAAKANPLPEYQWALAEGLRAAGREPEATKVEARLQISGAANDPRTFALFLATRGEDPATAVRLGEAEMRQRQDIFTQDALAWALTSAGRVDEARPHMKLALAEGTEDGRLFFHAAVIARRAGQADESKKWFTRAAGFIQTLLPSEREQFLKLAEDFPASNEIAGQPTMTHDLTTINFGLVNKQQ
jgi:tetratricopeptide (TPR) repeat protein